MVCVFLLFMLLFDSTCIVSLFVLRGLKRKQIHCKFNQLLGCRHCTSSYTNHVTGVLLHDCASILFHKRFLILCIALCGP